MFQNRKRRAAAYVAAAAIGATAIVGSGSLAEARPTAKAPVTGVKVVEGPEAGKKHPSVAVCPEGMRVLSGGFRAVTWGDTDAVIVNAPMGDGRGWAAAQMLGRLRARAVCVPEDQAPQVAAGPASAAGGDSEAHCPTGTKAIGGGYVTHGWSESSIGGHNMDAVKISAPTKNGNGWWASQQRGYIEARVLCS
ncbi:hypothetical protein [Streptomyces sp. NPDC056255]|uniref:hypothetical protein n=1 Tax=Streptomyces sp. NPDC056255 TaxID=3345764 RepID=UPI0035DEB1EE